MTTDLRRRIDALFARDVVWALLMVIALWLVVGVVFFGIQSHIETPGLKLLKASTPAGEAARHTLGIKLLLEISGMFILAFNTAAIVAMLGHYKSDKDFIYELDLRHLDAGKAGATKH